MEKNKDCSTCYHWLGGVYDCCRLNLEAECRAGEYEAWEPKRRKGQSCGSDGCQIEADKKEGAT